MRFNPKMSMRHKYETDVWLLLGYTLFEIFDDA